MPRSKAFRKILKAQSEANQKRDDDIYRHGVDAFGLNNLDDVPFIPEEMKRTLGKIIVSPTNSQCKISFIYFWDSLYQYWLLYIQNEENF